MRMHRKNGLARSPEADRGRTQAGAAGGAAGDALGDTRERCAAANRTCGRGERGNGRLGTLVWVVLLAAFAYVCTQVVPVLYAEYQFQDAMQTTARFATINRQSPEQIRKALVVEAKSKDIPVEPENIHVTSEAGNVKINAAYSVTVDLRVYQLTLNLHPSASNNAL
jgi:hypothetical protein